VFLYYLIEYNLKKSQLEGQLTFLLGQLNFPLQTGRASVFEMLQSLVNSLSPAKLTAHAGLIYVSAAASLVNDESPECRQFTAVLLRTILQKLDVNNREQLFGATLLWLKDKKVRFYDKTRTGTLF
jgi:U3 small nucleolar RNA-associated protein 20